MEKMRMETPDMVQGNIEKIEALFPNCVTETRGEDGKLKKAINFNLLRQMLSGDVAEGDEAYEFTWVGKKAAIVEANRPIRKTLRPCPEDIAPDPNDAGDEPPGVSGCDMLGSGVAGYQMDCHSSTSLIT